MQHKAWFKIEFFILDLVAILNLKSVIIIHFSSHFFHISPYHYETYHSSPSDMMNANNRTLQLVESPNGQPLSIILQNMQKKKKKWHTCIHLWTQCLHHRATRTPLGVGAKQKIYQSYRKKKKGAKPLQTAF